MRVVLQRVSSANVLINGKIKSQIQKGLLIFLGIELEDNIEDLTWLAKKISTLRIFNNEDGIMNKSVIEIDGEAIVVSQFTLHAKTKKGKRPSYIKAAKPAKAIPLYKYFIEELSLAIGKEVKSGKFAADMQISLVNDGPVTIIIDSKNKE